MHVGVSASVLAKEQQPLDFILSKCEDPKFSSMTNSMLNPSFISKCELSSHFD